MHIITYIIFFVFIFINNTVLALYNNPTTVNINEEYQNAYIYALKQKNLVLPIKEFKQKFLISINSNQQKLSVYNPKGVLLKSYTISTSKKGLGQLLGSYKTPVGLHQIVEKIGDNVPHYGIFRHRQFTNRVWQKYFFLKYSNQKYLLPHKKDFIVTRILRLQGLEPGINYGKNYHGQVVDSLARAIYIHGTTMEWKLGKPTTIGCIHLSSKDIVELFNLVPIGSLVMIY